MRLRFVFRLHLLALVLAATLAANARGQANSIPQRLPPVAPVRSETGVLNYDRGFVLAPDMGIGTDGKDADFLMRINSWMQLRYTNFDSSGPNPDQNTFSFERLRLSFAGNVFSPDMQYFIQMDGNTDQRSGLIFLDYFGNYDVGHDVLGYDRNRLAIKFGQWKVPFSRSRSDVSGRQLAFGERSIANVFFDLNRSLGVGLNAESDQFVVPIRFETAVFNGFRTGTISTNRNGGLDRNFGWSARMYSDWFSEFGDDGESDLSWHEAPTLRLGAGVALTRNSPAGIDEEFKRPTVIDSGVSLASILPAGVTGFDEGLATVDAQYKCWGLSLIADYYWRYISQFSGASVPNLFDHGFNLQAGYFVVPQKLESLARWARIVGDSGTLGVTNECSDEMSAGVVWYFRGHNAKILQAVSYIDSAPLTESRLDIEAGDIGWLYQTQLQLAF